MIALTKLASHAVPRGSREVMAIPLDIITDVNIPDTQKTTTAKTAKTQPRATPIPPARIGVPRERDQHKGNTMSAGRQASPVNVNPQKRFNLYSQIKNPT